MVTKYTKISSDIVPVEISHERRAKKVIAVLDGFLISIGFNTTILQHIIAPVVEGGMGISLTSLAAGIACVAVVGVSTILMTVLASYFFFKIIKKDEKEVIAVEQEKEKLEEQQIEYFAKLLYMRHLLNKNSEIAFYKHLSTSLSEQKLGSNTLTDLANTISDIYKEIAPLARQSKPSQESEQKAITNYLMNHSTEYLPRIQRQWSQLYVPPDSTPKKNWRPAVIGGLAGFISFMCMSPGFIGTYSSVITLALGISAVNLAVPVLGIVVFAVSLAFALLVAIIVARYTNKSMQRQELLIALRQQQIVLDTQKDSVQEVVTQLLEQKNTQNVARQQDDSPRERKLSIVSSTASLSPPHVSDVSIFQSDSSSITSTGTLHPPRPSASPRC